MVVVMRKKIVDQICREASPERAAQARALLRGHGNLMDELIELGFAPAAVLETCSELSGIPTAPAHWLKTPKPPHVEIDTVLCRSIGAAPVASTAGRLCIAYGDVEMAAQHASLGLPPHQPYLALRTQLEKALALLPVDDSAETRVATAETLHRPPRTPGEDGAGFEDVRTEAAIGIASRSTSPSPRGASRSVLDDPTEAVGSLSKPSAARSPRAASSSPRARVPAARPSPSRDDQADEQVAAGTPLPPPAVPPPSAGMIGAEEPWQKPRHAAGEQVPVVPVGASLPIATKTSTSDRRGSSGSGPHERSAAAAPASRPAIEIVPVTAGLPPGVTMSDEVSVSGARRRAVDQEHAGATRQPETSRPSKRQVADPVNDSVVARSATEPSGAVPRRGGGLSIQPSRAVPGASVAESLDPPVAPEGGRGSGFMMPEPSGGSRRPMRAFESLDPSIEGSGPAKRQSSPPSSGPAFATNELFVDPAIAAEVEALSSASSSASLEQASSSSSSSLSSSKLLPIVVVVLSIVVVGVVVAIQAPEVTGAPSAARDKRQTNANDAQRDASANANAGASKRAAPLVDDMAMDGKISGDLGQRQAELVAKGKAEPDHAKAVALFDQAVRLNPNAPGSQPALLERAHRLLALGEVDLAQDTVMQLRRRKDAKAIAEEIEQLLERIQEARQKK